MISARVFRAGEELTDIPVEDLQAAMDLVAAMASEPSAGCFLVAIRKVTRAAH